MESRRRSDCNDIPMVSTHDAEDEESQFNAIDAGEEEGEEEQYGEEAEDSKLESFGNNPKHWMRFLKTQSTKHMGGVKMQRTMARFMNDVFQVTFSAAAAQNNQMRNRTSKQDTMDNRESTEEMEKMLRNLLGHIQQQCTLPLGTMGADQSEASTIMNAQAASAGMNGNFEGVMRELAHLKSVTQTMRQEQSDLQAQVAELKSQSTHQFQSLMQSQAEILSAVKGGESGRISARPTEERKEISQTKQRVSVPEDYDMNVKNKVETSNASTDQLAPLMQQTGQFADPMTMSIGSNLLAMLNSRSSIQTNTTDPMQKEQAKGQSQHSAQMRKCMKNFNFKLDYNEIDRIIEEHEETAQELSTQEESKKAPQVEYIESIEEVSAPKVSTAAPTTSGQEKPQARKRWGQQQDVQVASSPIAKTKKPGVRVQRNMPSALQSSSNDPILQLLKKESQQTESEAQPSDRQPRSDMPLQMAKRENRDGSPIIGGGAQPRNKANGAQRSSELKTSALSQLAKEEVQNPYGMARPRPVLGQASGTTPNSSQDKKVAPAKGKRQPGFGGFKAPPASDLIDQLLLEQDQDSIQKKGPAVAAPGGRAGSKGFGGFKAPKTDMIDKLLLGAEEEDDDNEEGDPHDSLRNDGKPAIIKPVAQTGIQRLQSEHQGVKPSKSDIGRRQMPLRHAQSQQPEGNQQISSRRKNSEKSDDEPLNLEGLEDEDDEEDVGQNPFYSNNRRRARQFGDNEYSSNL